MLTDPESNRFPKLKLFHGLSTTGMIITVHIYYRTPLYNTYCFKMLLLDDQNKKVLNLNPPGWLRPLFVPFITLFLRECCVWISHELWSKIFPLNKKSTELVLVDYKCSCMNVWERVVCLGAVSVNNERGVSYNWRLNWRKVKFMYKAINHSSHTKKDQMVQLQGGTSICGHVCM